MTSLVARVVDLSVAFLADLNGVDVVVEFDNIVDFVLVLFVSLWLLVDVDDNRLAVASKFCISCCLLPPLCLKLLLLAFPLLFPLPPFFFFFL